MTRALRGVVTSVHERQREGWGGSTSWFTLFSGGVTPTDSMTAGIMEIAADGGELKPHRREPAEIYYVLEGKGVLTIEGVEPVIAVGAAVFIPGDAEHSLRNENGTVLKIFYVFPTDRFAFTVLGSCLRRLQSRGRDSRALRSRFRPARAVAGTKDRERGNIPLTMGAEIGDPKTSRACESDLDSAESRRTRFARRLFAVSTARRHFWI